MDIKNKKWCNNNCDQHKRDRLYKANQPLRVHALRCTSKISHSFSWLQLCNCKSANQMIQSLLKLLKIIPQTWNRTLLQYHHTSAWRLTRFQPCAVLNGGWLYSSSLVEVASLFWRRAAYWLWLSFAYCCLVFPSSCYFGLMATWPITDRAHLTMPGFTSYHKCHLQKQHVVWWIQYRVHIQRELAWESIVTHW